MAILATMIGSLLTGAGSFACVILGGWKGAVAALVLDIGWLAIYYAGVSSCAG